MASLRSGIWLTIANILIPIAIFTFAVGFFPYKPFLPGLAQYDLVEFQSQPVAPFDRVIFMVVDALRSDFVYSEGTGFDFVQSLIREGSAMPFTAHATSPTITMPRIKAITTGSTPSFLDLILNFAEADTSSSLVAQDTWLAQMKAKKTGKMIMYGDDTWLKLFPETFDRADGTSSFFVADFTEVDNNVTRHVPDELLNNDWNTMVLHFLGLDHIGHKAGPRSPNMIPKQKEMDSIVQQMYEAMEKHDHLKNTLLVLAGDHGMNDAGNHGGSASGETSPALVFASPKLKEIISGQKSPVPAMEDFQYYTTIEQSDIAPTLAGLLGFPVPKNNLGTFIPGFLPFWPNSDEKIQILLQNAKQILPIVTATCTPAMFEDGAPQDCSTPCSDMEQLACDWISITNQIKNSKSNATHDADILLWALSKWSKDAQEIMSGAASNYDMSKLIGGQVVAGVALVFSIAAAWPTLSRSWLSSIPFLAVTLSYGILMFASSYVEEEHHFWYWTTSGWFTFLSIKSIARRGSSHRALLEMATGIVTLTALRIIRRWNQTGQKFAGEPDIAHTFLTEHNIILWLLVLIAYTWNSISLMRNGFPGVPRANILPSMVILLLAAVIFKMSFTKEDAPELMESIDTTFLSITDVWTLTGKARIVFTCIGAFMAFAVISRCLTSSPTSRFRKGLLSTINNLLTTFLLTQSRTTNIPIFLLFSIASTYISSFSLDSFEITTTILLLQHVSFFAMGGSNAISSIDLSLAYNGVSGFNVVAVGFLTFVGNWAGPIWWAAQAAYMLVGVSGRQASERAIATKAAADTKYRVPVQSAGNRLQQQHLALLTVFVTAHLVFVMAACTVLRAHLFIWTVFSPKFLYSMAWSLGVHFLVNIALGSGLSAIGRSSKGEK